jgi:predicted metallo-beta-lactamase superfamily hydrolase
MANDASLPVEAVRDLLGIARALFAARKRELATQPELDELAAIGKKLANVLKLAKSGPDTIGYRSARQQAEDACTRLGRIVAKSLPAAVVVEAAVVRIRKRRGPFESEREEKRAARRVRS